MLNLLPPEIKNEIKHEYVLRFGVVCLVLFIFTMFLNIVVSLPYTISARLTRIDSGQKMQKYDQLNQGTTTQETTKKFDLLTQQIDLLKTKVGRTASTTTALLQAVILDKPVTVSLTSFSINTDTKHNRVVVVSGNAVSREALQDFASNLNNNNWFSKVDLPVSNFSKKTDIDFSINVTVQN